MTHIRFDNFMNGVDNLRVTGTAANVPAERLPNEFFVGAEGASSTMLVIITTKPGVQ